VLEVNKGVGGPQFLPEFFPRYQFPGLIKQDGEDLKRAW
jgi:hypothetical protein